MNAINWDAALGGDTCLLECGRDFEQGTDHSVLLEARRQAIRRGVALKIKLYRRFAEVDACNREVMHGRRFPVVVVRGVKVTV